MALEFVAGALGGAAGIVVGQPFDTLKVLQQTQASGHGTSLWTTFRQSVSTNGYIGLFDGLATPLLGNLAMQSILFGCYGTGLQFLRERQKSAQQTSTAKDPNQDSLPQEQPLSHHFLAGSFTGVVQWPVATAVELAKIQIQNSNLKDRKDREYKGSIDAALRIYRNHGAAALMRGGTITLFRDVFYGAYFLIYEGVRRGMMAMLSTGPNEDGSTVPNKFVSTASVLTAGAFAGVLGWAIVIPIDTIKTRIQAEPMTKSVPRIADVVRELWRADRARGFLRGMGPVVLRAAPSNMATFGVYELILYLGGGRA